MTYNEFEALTDDESAGTTIVPYNVTFNYLPLSHKDLTIAFAFSWHFYMVLYILVGTLSVVVIFLFMGYHRIMARPGRR
jgi:hypothetical protein